MTNFSGMQNLEGIFADITVYHFSSGLTAAHYMHNGRIDSFGFHSNNYTRCYDHCTNSIKVLDKKPH